MLKIINQAHYDRVVAFAEKRGIKALLDERLEYLRTYADKEQTGACVVELHQDWAPASFSLLWLRRKIGELKFGELEYGHWFNGGLIYHGSQVGWSAKEVDLHIDPLSVRIGGDHGENPWSVHT